MPQSPRFWKDWKGNLASNDDRPEFRALGELEEAVRQVSDELAIWRKRAHKAEGGASGPGVAGALLLARERVVELEGENEELRRLIQRARSRVTGLLTRLRFLEEQATSEVGQR